MRRALLTGATGFIGGHFAARVIGDGWSVAAIMRPGSDTTRLPVEVEAIEHCGSVEALTQAIKAFAPDLALHLASLYVAEHQPAQIAPLITSNVRFVAELAEALTAAGITRLVNTGTAWQHLGTSDYRPVNLYAATKQAAEDVLRYYHDARGLSVVTLKLFDSYGPGDTRRKLVQLLVDSALSGETLAMSPGEQQVDLSHVHDIVDAMLVAGERMLVTDVPEWESFFVGGRRMTVRALADVVGQALGRPLAPAFGARPYRTREVMQPCPAVPLLPGWQPRIDLAAGIRQLAGV